MSILIFIIWHQKCFWAKFLELQPSGWLYLRTKQFLNLTNFPSTSFFPIFSTPFNYLHHFKPPFSTNFSTTVLSYFVNPRNQLVFFFFVAIETHGFVVIGKGKKNSLAKNSSHFCWIFPPLSLRILVNKWVRGNWFGYVGIDLVPNYRYTTCFPTALDLLLCTAIYQYRHTHLRYRTMKICI